VVESLEPQARVRDSDNLNDRLFCLAYDELRRLASAVGRSGASPTLSPTALVHEAWIKMASSPGADFQDALHFKRVAARAMRQVLVDAARRKQTRKRGGLDAVFLVTFDEGLAWSSASPESILALHQALDELARRNPRQAEVAVLPGDTEETLAARVLEQEHRLYPETLATFAQRFTLPDRPAGS